MADDMAGRDLKHVHERSRQLEIELPMLRLGRFIVKIPNGAESEIELIELIRTTFDPRMSADLTQRPSPIEDHFAIDPLGASVVADVPPRFLEDLALIVRKTPFKLLLRHNLKVDAIGG